MSWFDSLLPASNVSVPQPYQLTHDAGADRGAYGGTQALGQYNLGGQNLGQYSGLTQQGVNNPWAALYQTGAGVTGAGGIQAGQNAFGAGGQVLGTALSELPDVQTLLNMGFDPQNALYARTAQQVADQNAARAQQSGVGGTPYGQGVQNQANSNFNIDWQNNLLQRALAGAQGAGGLLGSAGAGVQQGAGIQNAGLQEWLQGYAQPYNTYGAINANSLDLLRGAASYGQQAAQIPQQQIQDYLAYLNQSNQNQQTGINAQNLNLNKQNSMFNQANTLGQDAGQAFGSLAGMPMSFGGYNSNPFASNFGSYNNPYPGMPAGSNPTFGANGMFTQ